MLRLIVGSPGDVVVQHREVVRNDQVVFCIAPRFGHHRTRLSAPLQCVIRRFGVGSAGWLLKARDDTR